MASGGEPPPRGRGRGRARGGPQRGGQAPVPGPRDVPQEQSFARAMLERGQQQQQQQGPPEAFPALGQPQRPPQRPPQATPAAQAAPPARATPAPAQPPPQAAGGDRFDMQKFPEFLPVVPRKRTPFPQRPGEGKLGRPISGPYEEEDRLCYFVWAISVVTFITVIIPLGLFVLSMPSTGYRTAQPSAIPGFTNAIPEAQFCATRLRQDTSRVLMPSPADRYSFGTGNEGVQYRDVICVLDIKYHIKTPPYSPRYLPLSYCSTLIFSSLALFDNVTTTPKRSGLHTGYLRELDRMKHFRDSLKHRSKEVPIYVTVGGDLADSANISKALGSQYGRNLFAHLIEHPTERLFKGLHLDWDHPGGRCGNPNDTAHLHALVSNLNFNVELMLSVPPSPALVSLYNLSGIIQRLKLVIVKTHTIRHDNLLACTGDRTDAHAAFMAIRASVPESYRNKLAYTIQVGVDKFEPNSAVPAVTDPTSGHPGHTTYRRVCSQYPDVEAPVDVECRLGTFVEHGKEYQVAFAGPRELKARMRNTYADGMGSVPVVVYGLDLDDFLGRCPGGVMSPLVRAVATGGP